MLHTKSASNSMDCALMLWLSLYSPKLQFMLSKHKKRVKDYSLAFASKLFLQIIK